MNAMRWAGVMPAITTPFTADDRVDEKALHEHVDWMIRSGCTGIVPLGSLGEGATLDFDEKMRVLQVAVAAAAGRVPVVSAVSALSTREAVRIARKAEAVGCRGLMVLPAYVHKGPWREHSEHFSAVFDATPLSCMLYNNPIAYGVDVRAEQIREFAERHPNLHAVKESSGDSRRVTAIVDLLGERLAVFVGLDDMLLEGVAAGASGWIAGLVNALPEESVQLFEHAIAGRTKEARELYSWFLPLLRLDTLPEFVQAIKVVQHLIHGNEAFVRLRAPRGMVEPALFEHIVMTLRSRGYLLNERS
jgi:4-hydroxy-tetrahydrodipicolinate synthase